MPVPETKPTLFLYEIASCSTYPSEVLLRKILGLGDVALGLGAVSCVACIPADGGTLKMGTL